MHAVNIHVAILTAPHPFERIITVYFAYYGCHTTYTQLIHEVLLEIKLPAAY